MTQLQTFLTANKVFLLGLAGAIFVVLQQYLGQPTVDWMVVGYAALMAVLSYIGNQWRGQGVTILGVLGTLAYTFTTSFQGTAFTWSQFILAGIAALLAMVAPPPKNLSYEKSPQIMNAKQPVPSTKAMGPKLAAIALLLLISNATMSQTGSFFKKSPLPAKTYSIVGGAAIAPAPSIQNFIKPIIGVSASVSNGTSLAGGIGVSFQHSIADAATNSWIIQYSISAIGFLGTTGTRITGTGGLIFGIPGTGGLIQIGPGYDFTQKQIVLLTGVGISIF